jgi:hypothetical protein
MKSLEFRVADLAKEKESLHLSLTELKSIQHQKDEEIK